MLKRFFTTIIPWLLLAGCDDSAPPLQKEVVRPVILSTVQNKQTQQVREFPAIVFAAEAADLSFRLSGTLVELKPNEGAKVEKGEVLARLDDRDLRNQLADKQASYKLANAEFNRFKTLLERKMISRSDYDQAEAKMESAKAALDLARDQLHYSVLKAPFEGRIASITAENHQYIQAKQTILVLENREYLDIHVEIPEQFIINIREDAERSEYQPSINFESRKDKVYLARYKEHSSQITPGSRTYKTVLTLPKPKELNILPGMSASVTIDFGQISQTQQHDSRWIPVSAVQHSNHKSGKPSVWRYDDASGTVSKEAVVLGELSDEGIQILSGLEVGDQVVTAGLQHLKDGLKVKPWVKEKGL